MIVSHFSTFPYGGAAAAVNRLHQQHLAGGIDSRILYHICERDAPADESFHHVEFPPKTFSGVTSLLGKMSEKRRKKNVSRLYNEHLQQRDENLETFSMPQLFEQTPLDWKRWKSDIVHLHWIAFFADYPSFFETIPNETPIVWTMHDMNPLTGGCHYSGGCTRFENGCGMCPQLVNPSPNDVSKIGFDVKKKSLKNKNITVVTPSQWLSDLAQRSPIWPANTNFEVIRYGFDLSGFKPINQRAARQEFNLPLDSVLIGFGAEDTANHRKGFDLLMESLTHLDCETKVEFVVFGSGKVSAECQSKYRSHELGYLRGQEKLTAFYNACDIVVVPSREDNSPQIGLEALACGTPVVAFNIGGIPDYVIPQKTGLLSVPENSKELAGCLRQMITDTTLREQCAANARQFMESNHEVAEQGRQYESLYRSLLHGQRELAA